MITNIEKVKLALERSGAIRPGDKPLNLNSFHLIQDFYGENKLTELLGDGIAADIIADIAVEAMPKIYIDFLSCLLGDCSKLDVFDPCFSFSSVLLYQNFKSKRALCFNEFVQGIIQKHFETSHISTSVGFLPEDIATVDAQFDKIISTLPNFHKIKGNLSSDNFKYFTHLYILPLLEKLREDGELILTVPNSFLYYQEGKQKLIELGVNIKAVFSFSKSLFYSFSGQEYHIVVLTKGIQNETFVAPIQENTIRNVVSNYLNGTNSNSYELGEFTDIMQLNDISSWLAQKQSKILASRIGLEPLKILDFGVVKSGPKRIGEEVVFEINDIFIHRHSNRPVTRGLNDDEFKYHNYVRLSVDEAKVSSNYLIHYFNSELGKLQLDSIRLKSSALPIISSNLLQLLEVYLPERSAQDEILELENKIEYLNLELVQLRDKLWSKPKLKQEVSRQLKLLNPPDRLEHWIDILPFPLSSILWRFYATKSAKEKVEHLLNFFEAFAEFLVTSILSILSANEEFYESNKHEWLNNMNGAWHKNATFGSWKVLFTNLAKSLRVFSQNDSSREQFLMMFRGANEDFLKLITSKDLGNLIEEAVKYRNAWKGHGGITNEADYKQREIILSDLLLKIRKEIGNGFDCFKVVAPKSSECVKGIHYYTTRLLSGARTPFSEIELKSTLIMEKFKLYIILGDSLTPYKMLDFVTFNEENNAIYFYSKIESKKIKWISYHYTEMSELFKSEEDDDDLKRMINTILP